MRFLSIAKPGIIVGNIITLTGGFFLASSPNAFQFSLLFFTIIGMSFIIASGCVLNNVIDQDIDRLMERTKDRVMAKKLISNATAVFYALLLGVIGFVVLGLNTNWLAVIMAAVGLLFYVGVYSLWWKRRSIYSTLVGGVSGAMPPVVGYCVVTHQLGLGALLLFLILFFWQIPHVYAISIYLIKDYTAASLPVLPIKKDIQSTKKTMLCYVILFAAVSVLPGLLGYTGIFYLLVALCFGLGWLGLAISGLCTTDHQRWARRMFLFSILNITALSFSMIVK